MSMGVEVVLSALVVVLVGVVIGLIGVGLWDRSGWCVNNSMDETKLNRLRAIVFSLNYTVTHLKAGVAKSGKEAAPNLRRYFAVAAKLLAELEPLIPPEN